MANYLQVMTATMAYSMKFPDLLNSLFIPVERLGSSGETLMSYDGFTSSTQIKLFAPSSPVLKTFMIAILPILLLIGIAIFWGILHLIFKKWLTDYKRNVIVSMITILFLLHPTLTETALGMFQCIQIDENEYKVRIDLSIECYSTKHISWGVFIALPMMIVWVIGFPLLGLIILIKNRNRLDEPRIQRYFIVLYQGLKSKRFYWEFVNTLRKVLIVSFNVFLAAYPSFYKGVSAIILILIVYRIQLKLAPFKLKDNNEGENLSFLAACITLYGGLLFVDDEEGKSNPFIDFAAFVVIVIMNVRFFLLWIYLMTKTNHKYKFIKKITNALRILLCRKKKELTLIEPESIRRKKNRIANLKKRPKNSK